MQCPLYFHLQSVVWPATVMHKGQGMWSSAVCCTERSAICERYSKPVRLIEIHSKCAVSNEMNDFSILPFLDISCGSNTLVSVPTTHVHVKMGVSKPE